MSASYDEESTADLDWVRSQLGDIIDSTSDGDFEEYALHTDERIAFVLEAWPEQRGMALSQLAQELATRFAQEPVKVAVAGIAVDYTERIKAWSVIAAPYVAWLTKQATKVSSSSASKTPLTMFGLARGRRG